MGSQSYMRSVVNRKSHYATQDCNRCLYLCCGRKSDYIYTCKATPCDILKVKNALTKPVHPATAHHLQACSL